MSDEHFLSWIKSALNQAYGVVSGIVCIDGNGDFTKVSPSQLLPDLSGFTLIGHDHEEFLTQAEIEALPGFGSGSGPLVMVADIKSVGSAGGSSVAGVQIRDINTILHDNTGLCQVSGNQIQGLVGDFVVQGFAPFSLYGGGLHSLMLYDAYGSAYMAGAYTFTGHGHYGSELASMSSFIGKCSLNGSELLEIHHYLAYAQANDGLGASCNQSWAPAFTYVIFRGV